MYNYNNKLRKTHKYTKGVKIRDKNTNMEGQLKIIVIIECVKI